ncbi:unnamed protein product [Rhizoctonia solani]|uniref:Uracil-DNA glycosylase-like domain-containing protein n=1 Tax=Rhizoctonia solani TaxID=456999 RepID=A0A8H3H917_9AGAM|nr:unnamed protein product [Rhizoctonia solani]
MNIKHEVPPVPVMSKYFSARGPGEVIDQPRLDEKKAGASELASRSGTEESRADLRIGSNDETGDLATVKESDEHESRPVSKRPKRRAVARAEVNINGPVAKEPKPKKRRLKRGYAPPEVYAHLNYVQDCLDYDLNILFCGINPGQKSAGDGHHFANPLNGFWRCLHQGAGLTDVLVPPSEDHTLPERFGLGIINLIDRPSAEMTELSLAERRAAVPGFLRKVHKWQPKVVCMVGKGIWEDVFAYVSKASKGKCKADEIHVEECSSQSGQRGWAELKASFEFDIQPICLLHSTDKEGGSKRSKFDIQPICLLHSTDKEGGSKHSKRQVTTDGTMGSENKRTLFFVVPSTSSRVFTHQLPDKIILFQLLKKRWEELRAGVMAKSVVWQIRVVDT